jgi:creatinine amidohydrolase
MALLNDAGQKVLLRDYTWEELSGIPGREELKFLLPIGAIEEHGPHLTLHTDALQAEKISEMAARRVPGVIVMPVISYGFCVDTMNYCGTVSLSAETILMLVADIVKNLYRHGFRKLLIYNGHGGNNGILDASLKNALAGLSGPGEHCLADFNLYLSNSYEKISGQVRELVKGRDYGHACEIETSVMLALAPEAVNMDKAVEEYMDGDQDTVWRVRDMQSASKSGIHGAANLATPEKGAKILEMLVGNLVALLKKI